MAQPVVDHAQMREDLTDNMQDAITTYGAGLNYAGILIARLLVVGFARGRSYANAPATISMISDFVVGTLAFSQWCRTAGSMLLCLPVFAVRISGTMLTS